MGSSIETNEGIPTIKVVCYDFKKTEALILVGHVILGGMMSKKCVTSTGLWR